MRPVDQTMFGFKFGGAPDETGNCFAACVASILELPLDEVPHVMHLGDGWFVRFSEWLRGRGLYACGLNWTRLGDWRPEGIHILTGTSPRGSSPDDLHSVVARGDEILHDPHPSRAGLAARTEVMMLVALDPAAK